MRNTTAQLRRDIRTIKETLAATRKEKPVWFRLDEDDLTADEKMIIDGARKTFEEIYNRTKKEHNCSGTDVMTGVVPMKATEDEQAIFKAREIIFQRKAVPPLEYARRHPIH